MYKKRKKVFFIPSSLKGLLITYGAFTISQTFMNLFMNLYFFTQHGGILSVIFFQLANYLTWISFFYMPMLVKQRLHTRHLQVIASVLFVLLFFYAWIGNINPWLAGVLYGGGLGLFYFSQNISILYYTGEFEWLQSYLGFSESVRQTIGIVVPLAYSIMITMAGYTISFFTVLIIMITALLSSLFFTRTTIADWSQSTRHELPKDKTWSTLNASEFFYGMGTVLGYLMLSVQLSKSINYASHSIVFIGVINFVYAGIVTIVGIWVGKKKPKLRFIPLLLIGFLQWILYWLVGSSHENLVIFAVLIRSVFLHTFSQP